MSFFDRLFSRTTRIGTIRGYEVTAKGIQRETITIFEIQTTNGEVVRAGVLGCESDLRVGDSIEFQLLIGTIAHATRNVRREGKDGLVSIKNERIDYRNIRFKKLSQG